MKKKESNQKNFGKSFMLNTMMIKKRAKKRMNITETVIIGGQKDKLIGLENGNLMQETAEWK
jgi:hypothetical protein